MRVEEDIQFSWLNVSFFHVRSPLSFSPQLAKSGFQEWTLSLRKIIGSAEGHFILTCMDAFNRWCRVVRVL